MLKPQDSYHENEKEDVMDEVELGNEEPQPVTISKGVPINMDSSESDTDMSVPEASPEQNESTNKSPRKFCNARMLLTVGLLLAVLAALVIVPLSLRASPATTSAPTASPTVAPKVSEANTLNMAAQPMGVVETTSTCHKPSAEHKCDSEHSYNQCVALEQAGCQLMVATAMCPPTYSCADPMTTPPPVPEHPIVTPSDNEKEDNQCSQNPCDDMQSHNQCLELQSSGCKKLISTYSCPPIYSCADEPEETYHQCPEPLPDDECHSAQSQMECVNLAAAGCQEIVATRSCPPEYKCFDDKNDDRGNTISTPPAGSVTAGSSSHNDDKDDTVVDTGLGWQYIPYWDNNALSTAGSISTPSPTKPSTCHAPTPDNDCDSQESYEQCLALEASGCKLMIATMMCPPTYQCGDPTTEEQPVEDPTLPAREPGSQCPLPDDCHTEASHQQCVALAKAGCDTLIETAMCPPTYSCADGL